MPRRGGQAGVPSLDEIRSWGATTDVPAAGRALGLGRNRSYELARSGKFPVRIITIGQTYRVPVAELLAVLGVAADEAGADVA